MKMPLTSVVMILAAYSSGAQQSPPDVDEFLQKQMQLTADQVADIRKGKGFAKILTSSEKSDIFVFGAIYIRAEPAAYLAMMSDIDRLRKMPGYLAAGKFSEPPQESDLEGFTLDPDDIKDLKKCKPGHCELQLPEEFMPTARNSIDWTAPDLTRQVNDRAAQGMIRLLEAYQQHGNRALGTYQDKSDPLPVAEQFQTLLSKIEFFPQYLPELNRYLLDYPVSRPDATRDFFYWGKVNFGLKPTIRLNHAVVYRSDQPERRAHVLAIKQLYATHYFQTAIDLSFCVEDASGSGRNGFYLITLKASRQAGLTGFKGGLIRRAAVGKTRKSLERALNSIRSALEHQPLSADRNGGGARDQAHG